MILALALEGGAFASFFAGASHASVLAAVILSSAGCLVLMGIAAGGMRARVAR